MSDKAPNEQRAHAEWMRESSQDELLQDLSALLDRTHEAKMGVSITLSTGGMLLSGQLISEQWYSEQLAQQLANSPQPAPAFAKLATRLADDVKGRMAASAKGEELYSPSYIHLMNAKFYVPGQLPIPTTGGGLLWRGRISAIDGFTLASLAANT